MLKKIFLITVSLLLIFGAMPASAKSENEGLCILSIGDSISRGYGLNDPNTQRFTNLMLGDNDTLINKAVDGNTANGILNQLLKNDDPNAITEEDIKSANVVTVTCGGNDLMAIFYNKFIDMWNERNPNDPLTEENAAEKLEGSLLDGLEIANAILDPDSESFLVNDKDFENALSQYIEFINEIVSHINETNPNAVIIIATQYNPYAEFKSSLLAKNAYKGMEVGVSTLNSAIINNGADGKYIVAHVKTAFDTYEGKEDLYCADPSLTSINLDFHPTASGHAVIAETFKNEIENLKFASFTILHKYENLDGGFYTETENGKAPTGKTVFATIENKEGFTCKLTETPSGVVAEDGSLSLEVEYSRNDYEITWDFGETTIEKTYKFGASITPPEQERNGFLFKGWDLSVPQTMPAENLTFTAIWEETSSHAENEDENKSLAIIIAIVLCVIAVLVIVDFFILKKRSRLAPPEKETAENSDEE